jgi:hypothetical protein
MLMTAMPTRDDQANQLWVHNWDQLATDAVMAQGALASTLKTVARRQAEAGTLFGHLLRASLTGRTRR